MNSVEDFKKQITIVDSVRSHILMLIGLYGVSSGGKTVTALKWALSMVGPDALIGVIDTEQRRSSIAWDAVVAMARTHYGREPKGLKAVYLDPPYHPLKYVAAIQTLIEQGCKAITTDSMSHSWSGAGGYLDLKEEALDKMAGDDWAKREKCGMAAAARVKPKTHARLVDAVCHVPVPMFLCFRAKEKTRMEKRNGKIEIIHDDYSTPIQEEGLIYEMLISAEVSAREGVGGYCSFRGIGRKTTHPQILAMMPKDDEQFDFKHGEALAAWCVGAAAPQQQAQQPTKVRDTKMLKAELWQITAAIHLCKAGDNKEMVALGALKLQQYLLDEGLIDDTETLSELTEDRLRQVIVKVKTKLKENP